MQIDFEFADTSEHRTFSQRNPGFWPHFGRVAALANNCFGRPTAPRNRSEDVGFALGETCRDEFLEIVFLAVNGHGIAAQKLLRGLYERAVTAEYLRRNPERAERFVRYAAIQEFKAANKALEVVSGEQLDLEMARSGMSYEQIRQQYEQVKGEFPGRECDHCHQRQKGTAISWDIDFTSMARKSVDSPDDVFIKLFFACYALPTLQIHATLASAFSREAAPGTTRDERKVHDVEFTLACATLVFIRALQTQNDMFGLKLAAEIRACFDDVSTVWENRPHGPLATRGAGNE